MSGKATNQELECNSVRFQITMRARPAMTTKSHGTTGVLLSLLCSLSVWLGLGLAASPKLTLVEVWCVGDDGLTHGLRDALENAFKSSSDFQLSSGKKPGTLVVTIPTNVDWKQAKQADKRTKVLYRVEFASADDKTISESTGSCWDDALSKCASKIVKEARTAARKIH
jgi:hypothetical protein